MNMRAHACIHTIRPVALSPFIANCVTGTAYITYFQRTNSYFYMIDRSVVIHLVFAFEI